MASEAAGLAELQIPGEDVLQAALAQGFRTRNLQRSVCSFSGGKRSLFPELLSKNVCGSPLDGFNERFKVNFWFESGVNLGGGAASCGNAQLFQKDNRRVCRRCCIEV